MYKVKDKNTLGTRITHESQCFRLISNGVLKIRFFDKNGRENEKSEKSTI